MKNYNPLLIGTLIILLGAIIYLVYINKQLKAEGNANYNQDRQVGNNSDLTCYDLPNNSEKEVFGPKYWYALHSIANKIPCPSCREDGVKLMRFAHDLVNLKTAKNLYDPLNFEYHVNLIQQIKKNNNKWPQGF